MELLGQGLWIYSILILSNSFPHCCTSYITISNAWEFQRFTACQNSICLRYAFFILAILVVVSHMDLHFPDHKSVVHLSVLSYMTSPFPHFSVGLAVCLCLWLVRVHCIIWVLVICQIQVFVYCKYLPLCVLLFSVYNLYLLHSHIDVLLCFSSNIIFLHHAKT